MSHKFLVHAIEVLALPNSDQLAAAAEIHSNLSVHRAYTLITRGHDQDRAAGAHSGVGRLQKRVPLRYRAGRLDTLTIVFSQSGETADTIAAQREAEQKRSQTLARCTVLDSI